MAGLTLRLEQTRRTIGNLPLRASQAQGPQPAGGRMRGSIPELEFWYDFPSTYSYLSAMRIEAMAHAAGVKLAWRPFLLGPIFQAQGWSTSPFRLYASKGRYMRRDVERLAAERGLAFALPHHFPANSLAAARLAII